MNHYKNNLIRDLGIIALSVLLAIIVVKTGALKDLLTSTREMRFVGSFVSGMFFVSVFTAAPATVVLAEIAQSNSIFMVAFFGGLGALLGDLVIFRFIKDRLSEDLAYIVKSAGLQRLAAVSRLGVLKWLIPFIGALVVASPLPDELGLMMMGLSKMKTSLFIPLSLTLNFLGILAIGFLAKVVL